MSQAGIINTSGSGGGGEISTNVSLNTQVFISSGTYTPSAGTVFAIVELVGGGGGGGGVQGTTRGAGAGGGAGGYARKLFPGSTIGVSQVVTIGAGGAGGIGASVGSTGGTTSLGVLLSATGGSGGTSSATGLGSPSFLKGGAGGIGSSGDINSGGGPGGIGCQATTPSTVSGIGGNSYFGGGAASVSVSGAGNDASNYGSGGSGAISNDAAAYTGGAGSAGVILITEYILTIVVGGVNVVPVTIPAAYPYTTLTTDYAIFVNTGTTNTINLLASPKTGASYRIKDYTGTAAAHPITIIPNAGTIDGAASYVIQTNYGSVDLIYNGSNWNIF